MPQKEWSIKLDNIKHTLTLNHGTILRKYNLKLDGLSLNPKRELIKSGDKLTFNINTHNCIVIIRFNKGSFEYDCILDSHSIEMGEKIETPPEWTPPKKGCLKYGIYYLAVTVITALISLITGINKDKIDLILIIILIISAIILIIWKNR